MYGNRTCVYGIRDTALLATRSEISLLHKQGLSWAEIGELVGQRSRAVTADTHSHTIADYREIDRAALLD